METVHRDQSVAGLWVEDKMTRQSTHSLLRSLLTQLQDLFPNPLERGLLHDEVLIQSHTSRDLRTATDGTNLVVLNTVTGDKTDVFPADFSLQNHLILNHTIDRGSTGGALCHYKISKQYLWVVAWGFFHDVWNAVKTAAKKVKGNKWWNRIIQFSSVVNLNHGPFRSGAWGKSKQVYHKRYVDSNTTASARFREAATKTAAMCGKPTTNMDWDYWWQVLACLPSCVQAGPVCKFARWHSIEQCWNWYREELWFLREVLLTMDPLEAQKTLTVTPRK